MKHRMDIIKKSFLIFSAIFLYNCPMDYDSELRISITASSPSQDSIYIRWETEVAMQSYKIFRQSHITREYEYLATINNNDNSYLDIGLHPSTKYSYKIAYIDSNNKERFIDSSFFAVTQPHLIAHRGFWGFDGIVENTIRSLQAAADLGVYGSEFDVHITTDNIPVVYHDFIGMYGLIQQLPYSEIKYVALSNGERPPSLDDYLEAGKTLSIQLILEIKPHATPARDREVAQIVTDRVKYFGLEDRVDYITFSLDVGKELIRLQPDSNVGYLKGDLTPAELKKYGFSTLSYDYGVIRDHPKYLNEAKELGLITAVWTVNDLSVMESMNNQGITFITTDIPLQAKEYFEQKVYQYNF